MSVRITILNAVNTLCPNSKKIVTTAEVKHQLQCNYKKVSAVLWQLDREGYVKKVKRLGSNNTWTSNKEGREYLEHVKESIWTPDQLKEHIDTNEQQATTVRAPRATPRKSATINTSRYSPQALDAVKSLGRIVDENENLIQSIRVMHNTLGTIIANYDQEHDIVNEEE